MLYHIADARAEFACRLGVLRIMLKQMSIRSQHRSAPAGIGDYWRLIGFESIDVLAGERAGAFNIAGVRMQGAATNLRVGSLNFASVNFQHTRRRFVDPLEQSFHHATFEEQNSSALRSARIWSACILSRRDGMRSHPARAYHPV